MKLKMLIASCMFFVLLFTGCPLQHGGKPHDQEVLTEKQKIDAEAAKVQLNVPKKAEILAGELTEKHISGSGYDASIYAIAYKDIKPDNDKKEAAITFYLTKGPLASKERTVTVTGFKEKPAGTQEPSAQEKINLEVDKVQLDVPNKAEILAGELKQENISASGYDAASYAIKYEKLDGNSAERKAEITFFLKKDGITSKPCTVIITGFKAKPAETQELSAQEKINAEVDKVEVDAKNKAEMTADQLTAEHLTFSAYDTAYSVHCKTIKGDINKKEAEVTFSLTKGVLTSKERTVTITGFKEKAVPPETIDITETTLLALFDLTETKITASAAAKKIAEKNGQTVGDYTFEEAQALAYDDEAGTFTVKVKGTKNGKGFDKEITVTGFSNPYANINPSFVAAELNFAFAIEYNKKLDTFIQEANANIGNVLQKFIFSDAAVGQIEKGISGNYILAAALEKKEKKIKIKPLYMVKHLKKDRNGTEIESTEDCSSVFWRLNEKLTKPYFSKNDVFTYLLGKTDNSIIRTDPNKFASFYYAFAKHLNVTPDGLISDAAIQTIMERYNQDGGQYKMQIDTAILKPRHGGIKADDYTGTVEIDYCIAEKEQIEQMLDGKHMDTPITAIAKAKASGFKKVTKENAGTLFDFKVKLTTHADSQNKWTEQKYLNYSFLKAEYNSQKGYYIYKINNPFTTQAASPYYLFTVNGKAPEEVFALEEPKFLSECAGGEKIFIENISFNKEAGSTTLKINVRFLGNGEEIVIERTAE